MGCSGGLIWSKRHHPVVPWRRQSCASQDPLLQDLIQEKTKPAQPSKSTSHAGSYHRMNNNNKNLKKKLLLKTQAKWKWGLF